MKYFFATLSAVFVLLLVMVGYTYVSAALPEENVAVLDEPKAHIQLITQNSNEHFWSTFKRGPERGTDNGTKRCPMAAPSLSARLFAENPCRQQKLLLFSAYKRKRTVRIG